MSKPDGRLWRWLMAVVIVHLALCVVHGTAHAKAHVSLPPVANAFVFSVILAGPLIGIMVGWRTRAAGAWIVAVSMAGALVFGLVNHFLLASPDHVTQVDPRWRALFGVTAILLAVTEAASSGLALGCARERSDR